MITFECDKCYESFLDADVCTVCLSCYEKVVKEKEKFEAIIKANAPVSRMSEAWKCKTECSDEAFIDAYIFGEVKSYEQDPFICELVRRLRKANGGE